MVWRRVHGCWLGMQVGGATVVFPDGSHLSARNVIVATGGLFLDPALAGVMSPSWSFLVSVTVCHCACPGRLLGCLHCASVSTSSLELFLLAVVCRVSIGQPWDLNEACVGSTHPPTTPLPPHPASPGSRPPLARLACLTPLRLQSGAVPPTTTPSASGVIGVSRTARGVCPEKVRRCRAGAGAVHGLGKGTD